MASLSLSVLLNLSFYRVYRFAILIVIKQAALTMRS